MDEELPSLHFVAGFLGSGKTTALVELARMLVARGISAGIVTNDQGRRQVDQAFVQASGIPSVAVSNGCLCCRYDDFEERVRSLSQSDRPEVIFAESVGSCADIVATVVKPFSEFRGAHNTPGTLTTFVDARMLEARYSDRPLPFSEGVLYIFDKQIEEAELLVINKRDLLTADRAQALAKEARRRYPDKRVLLHSALDGDDVWRWYESLCNVSESSEPRARSLEEMDYRRYGAAEQELAWLDMEGVLERAEPQAPTHARRGTEKNADRAAVAGLLRRFARLLQEAEAPVGHVKVIVTDNAGVSAKVSLTGAESADTLDGPFLMDQIPAELTLPADLILNARVLTDPTLLERAFQLALEQSAPRDALSLRNRSQEAFVPGFPEPIHRLA